MAFPNGFQLRLPRPKTFLGLMSLQTGTELIALALLFNKATGLYGLLAILTGYHISILQLSMYAYSVGALGALAVCMPHIRKQTPFPCLALAWLYVVDTLVNTAYIAVFAVTWFLAIGKAGGPKPAAPEEREAGAYIPPVEGFLGAVDTTTSTTLIVVFSLLRAYLTLVVMAYARQVLRQYVESKQGWGAEAGPSVQAEGPFPTGSPEGQGWKGKVARGMLSVGRGYWLSQAKGDGDEWTQSMNTIFHTRKVSAV